MLKKVSISANKSQSRSLNLFWKLSSEKIKGKSIKNILRTSHPVKQSLENKRHKQQNEDTEEHRTEHYFVLCIQDGQNIAWNITAPGS